VLVLVVELREADLDVLNEVEMGALEDKSISKSDGMYTIHSWPGLHVMLEVVKVVVKLLERLITPLPGVVNAESDVTEGTLVSLKRFESVVTAKPFDATGDVAVAGTCMVARLLMVE